MGGERRGANVRIRICPLTNGMFGSDYLNKSYRPSQFNKVLKESIKYFCRGVEKGM